MTFDELLEKVQKVPYQELREKTENFLEIVITKNELERLNLLLKEHFGNALKEEGQRTSPEANRYSEAYGGMRPNQTLYVRAGDTDVELAMLWPWEIDLFITVKVIREKKS